jgi:DNA-binding protein YbaB
MFGKLGEAKQKAEEMKLKLEAITVEGNAQGVRVIANANKKIITVNIAPELLNPANKEQLEDLLMLAIEHAMNQAENISAAEMKAMMGAMMPGMGNLFGN